MLSKAYRRIRSCLGKWKPLALLGLRAKAAMLGMSLRLEGGSNGRIRICSGDRTVLVASRHYPYVQDILEDFDYHFDAVGNQLIDGKRTVDYSCPVEHVLKPSGRPFFFTSFPESDATTSLYLEHARLSPGDIVFDVGAYCGATSHSFSHAVGPQGRVFAFEPDANNFEALQKNLARHELSNVTPIAKGLWSETTTLMFQSEGNLGSAVSSTAGRKTSLAMIPVISLDDAIEETEISRLDFVKIDIEGAEVAVLKHAVSFWTRFHPDFMIEPHMVDGRVCTDEVCRILAGHGYRCEIIPQAGLHLPLIFATANDVT
jgi:FkbM family methyltransferase